MKRFVSLVLWVVVTSIFVITFSVPAWSADKYQLRLAFEYPDKHPTVVNGIMPWIEEVKKLSNGRLEIQFFNPNALAPNREVYSAMVAGAVDMVGSPCHYVHGKFPLNTALQTPFTFNGAEASSYTAWDMYNESKEWANEFREVKILWQWGSAPFQLHTVKKMVRTLEDLKGMKIIGINPQIREILKRLGANPIDVTPPDSYLALERGMAEGMAFPLAPCRAFKITEVAKYHTIFSAMTDPFYGAINISKWNSLPPDLQKILTDTTGRKLSWICGQTLDGGDSKDSEALKKEGHEFYVLPPDEKQRWAEKVKDIPEKWLKSMEKKNIKGAKQVLEKVIMKGAAYSKIAPGGFK